MHSEDGSAAVRCTHNAGHLRAGWPCHSASPPTPTTAAVITERRWPPGRPASPTPLHGPHCRTLVPGASPVTARSHRCDTHYTQTALRCAALSAVRFLLIHCPGYLRLHLVGVAAVSFCKHVTGLQRKRG